MKTLILSIFLSLISHVAFAEASGEKLDMSGQPTLGNLSSSVQVVAFLEPKCPDSKRYQLDSFPQLKSQYIDNKKISYSVVTTSFLKQSMPAAVALLCVYHQKEIPQTELFFNFLDYIYRNQPPERDNWATEENLIKFAEKANTEIDLDQLKKCLVNENYRSQIEKNTALGNQLMGHLSTPTIYVNGKKVQNSHETIDYTYLKNAIEEALKH